MLTILKISKFAIIDQLRVEFGPGLVVLTGETGAGKSIIIDALNLILGGRGDSDFIRSGESTASVEAVFRIGETSILRTLEELGIEVEDGEVIIKRQLTGAGKNRCWVNDSAVTVGTLAQIGERLIDIHGQHDHQALLRPETHVDLLDLYGKTMPDRQRFSDEYAAWLADRNRLDELRAKERGRLEREDLLRFQLGEIDRAGLTPDEEEALKAEKNKLSHSEKLHQALDRALSLVSEEEDAALPRLDRTLRCLEPLCSIDPALEKQVERARNAFYEAQELVEELNDYARTLDFDPARLEEIEDRLAEINGLKRKHGGDIPSILARRDAMAAELESLSTFQEQMEELQSRLKSREATLAKLATALAEKREKTADRLRKNVEKELRDLSMDRVQFGVRFDYPVDDSGFVTFRGKPARLGAAGLGTLEFLFSSNAGEELRPLAKIASGGEISRIMLSLKTILNEEDTVPILIFDEVDTGIGGKVAETVGKKLKKIADGKQVFCISHLPQIAGMASTHFLVEKTVQGNRTHSSIRELSYEERVEEVARMSGGEKITATTREHARQMIQAKPAR
ncbi:MAG: DNA repair protein RecN [Nitrospinae bacterium CG11_big_fil_rev_8_21_14_0_20_56_8]|nr:MAG: DNA repair protein RecN [Nitrospinae bacterium CG11_big_fil_rev_8_21_14_0_20_56_8]